MKSFLTILPFFLFCSYANAQIKTLDLNHGKYLENSFKNEFVGKWKATNNTFKIIISKEKKHIQRNVVDVYVDVLNIKIVHFINNGEQISNRFTSDIMLLSTGDNNSFSGIYKDVISGNNIKIYLKQLSNNELLFNAGLPEIDVTNHLEKGTVFPAKLNLIRD